MEEKQPETELLPVPEPLWWIRDAPMFIDTSLVNRTHDTIVWPRLENETRQYSDKTTSRAENQTSGKVKAGFSVPEFLSNIGLKLDAGVDLDHGRLAEKGMEKTQLRTGTIVSNAERKLVELVAKYLQSFEDRILLLDFPEGAYRDLNGNTVSVADVSERLQQVPRPLVFIDILRETPIFPTAAEMEEGGFRKIYEALDAILLPGKSPRPTYSDDPERKRTYWLAVKENFQSRTAMEEIEKACDGERIGWIDFRLFFGEDGESAHLHVVPAGKYHTGVFGYNFVHRGFKYGCRVIGTLKSGNDINVLAIYDN